MSKGERDIRSLQKDGFKANGHGDARSMSSSCRMVPCWSQTIRPV